MVHHVYPLRIVCLVRAIVELLLGGYLLLLAARWGMTTFPSIHPSAKPVAGDREAFFVLGAVLVLLSLARGVQSLLSLRPVRGARRLGMALGFLDLATPLTMPFGLWILVVYRHPDTRDFFKRRDS